MSIVRGLGHGRRARRSQYLVNKAIVEALESRILLTNYVVTNNNGDDSSGSLRYEINAAESAGTQTITFASNVTGSINLTGGVLPLDDTLGTLTIDGPGANVLSINGLGTSQVFSVSQGSAAEIDGLTITGGFAVGFGGAIYTQGTLTLQNSIVSGSSAAGSDRGGGIYNGEHGVLAVNTCTISNNYAGYYGGGITSEGVLTISGSTISGNKSAGSAGGIYNGGTLHITGSTISDNFTSNGNGGGLFSTGTATLTNCTITGNTAPTGGGVYTRGNGDITDCTISDNRADYGNAGGIQNTGTLTLTGSTISGNTAAQNGGGIFNASYDGNYGNTAILNSTITGNSASDGGGVFNSTYDSIRLTNSTLSYNSARVSGGGFYSATGYGRSYGGAVLTVTITDCTLYHNSAGTSGGGIDLATGPAHLFGTIIADSSHNDLSGIFAGTNNLIDDGSETISGSNNLYNESPILVPLGNYGGATETMPLAVGSPGVGANAEFSGVTTDQRGVSRSGVTPDIGAVQGGVWLVNTTQDPASPTTGVLSLREAVQDADSAGGNQWIGFAAIPFSAGPTTIFLNGSPVILDDSSGMVSIVGPGSNLLSVSAGGGSSVFNVSAGSTAAIDGMTIEAGSSTGKGGGIKNSGDLTVENSTVTGNSAQGGGGLANYGDLTLTGSTVSDDSASIGGGIYSFNGNLTITDSTVSGDSSTGPGGGVYAYGGSVAISGSTIANSSAVNDGGGLFLKQTSATIAASTIDDNSTTGSGTVGGGVEFQGGTLSLTNTTVSGDTAASAGGGVDNHSGTVTIVDSTIAGNHNEGINNNTGASTTVEGSIVAGDSGEDVGGTITGTYDVIGDTSSGLAGSSSHNLLDTNPLLAPLGDYGGQTETMPLTAGSPALAASSIFNGVTADQNGEYRSDAFPNIGAVEGTVWVVNTTGDPSSQTAGVLSLREAIQDADAAGGNQLIAFATSLTSGGPATITLNGSALELDDTTGTVTILGAGESLLTVSGNNLSNDFNVDAGSSADIQGLTISGGHTGGNGGGINNGGTLTVKNSTITGDTAASGGAVYNYDGAVVYIDSSTISGNSSHGNGGGIYNYGGTVTLTDSTLYNNETIGTRQYGGAIANWNGGTVTLTNCTLAENHSTVGGAIDSDSGVLTADNCTISNNSVSGTYENTGGIRNNSDNNSSTVLNGVIVAGNTDGDLSGGGFSGTDNFIGGGGLSGSTNHSGSISLSALGYYGGPTETVVPLPMTGGNPAFGNGYSDFDVVTDQRGFPRPYTGPDIGAFQTQGDDSLVVNTLSDDPVGDGQLSLRDAINLADALGGNQTITFESGLTGTISLDGSQLVLDDTSGTLSIDGPGANLLTIDGGDRSRDISAEPNSTVVISGFTLTGASGDAINADSANLTVANSIITGNSETGIIAVYGSTYIAGCTIRNNTSTYGGGGIEANDGTISIRGSTISGNTSVKGGGIQSYNEYINVINSTIADNTAPKGGGLYLDNANCTITDCTISSNTASSSGGGIYETGSTVQLNGTIVAGDTGGELSGTFTGTYNLIGDGSGGLSTSGSSHNILPASGAPPINPLLAPLGNYGGSTQTMALLPGSPALDVGHTFDDSTGDQINFDQRGVARPQGSTPDIGAFESKGFTVSITGGNGQSVVVGTPFLDSLSVSVTPIDPGLTEADLAGGIITFLAPSSGASALLGINQVIADQVVLHSSGTASITASAGGTTGSYDVIATAANQNTTNTAAGTRGLFSLSNTQGTDVEDLTATATTTGTINLRWENNAVVTTDNILRSTDGTHYSIIASIQAETTYTKDPDSNNEFLMPTVYQDTGLTRSTTYYYEVQSVNNGVVTAVTPATTTSSATTAAPGTYATTPLQTLVVPVYASGDSVSPSVTSMVLQAGVHYELVASGQVLCLPGWEDAEYFADIQIGNVSEALPNAPYTDSDWTGEVAGSGFVNAGISIDGTTLGENHSPYWGAYNTSDVYKIDIVGTGQTLSFSLFNDAYSGDSQGNGTVLSDGTVSSPLEVQIFAHIPAAPSNLVATGSVVSGNANFALSWTNNATDETGFEVLRSTDGVNFSEIPDDSLVSDSGVPIGATVTLTDVYNSITNPLQMSTPYYYEVIALGSNGNSGPSNVAEAEAAMTPVGDGSISGTVFEDNSSVDPPDASSRIGTSSGLTLYPVNTTFPPTAGSSTPGFAFGLNGSAPYWPGDSVLASAFPINGGSNDAPYVMQLTAGAGGTANAAMFADIGQTVSVSGSGNLGPSVNAARQIFTAGPGNAAGFTDGDLFFSNGEPGQLMRLTDGGQDYVVSENGKNVDLPLSQLTENQLIPPWITIPTPFDFRSEVFLDNSGAFGGDMVVSDANSDIYLVDSEGDYTELAADVASTTFDLNEKTQDNMYGGTLVAVPNDQARWGPLAGTILFFPDYSTPISPYYVDDLSISPLSSSSLTTANALNSETPLASPSLSISEITLINSSSTESQLTPDGPGTAVIVPTNANLYVTEKLSSSGNVGLYTAPASDFYNTSGSPVNITGDILVSGTLDDTAHEATIDDVYYNAASNELYFAPIILTNYAGPGNSNTDFSGIESVSFGPAALSSFDTAGLDAPLANQTVYLDTNNNGKWDPGEPTAVTNQQGQYTFNNLPEGTYQVGQLLQPGWTQVSPAQPIYSVNLGFDEAMSGIDFASEPGTPSISPPVFTSPAPNSAEVGEPFDYAFNATDSDPNATITYRLLEAPTGMTIDESKLLNPQIVWNVPGAPLQYGRVLLEAIATDNVTQQSAVAIQPFTLQYTMPAPTVVSGGTQSLDLSWQTLPNGSAYEYFLQRSTSPNFTGLSSTLIATTTYSGETDPDWVEIDGTPGASNGFYIENDPTNGMSYLVDTNTFGTSSTGSDQLFGNLAPEPTSGPGTKYYYRIIADTVTDPGVATAMAERVPGVTANPGGPGDVTIISAAGSAQTLTLGTTTPPAPVGLYGESTSSGDTASVNLTWMANQDPTGANSDLPTEYEIFRSANKDLSNPTQLPSIPAGSPPPHTISYTDSSSLPLYHTYYYWVEAENTNVSGSPTSAPSNVAVVTTGNTQPVVSAISSSQTSNTGSVTIHLSTTGTDPTGQDNSLNYVWSLTDASGNPISLSGSGASVTATVTKAGAYSATVFATDINGQSASQTATITVTAMPSSVQIDYDGSPVPDIGIPVPDGGVAAFTANVLDQFGNPMPTETITWSETSGSISPSNVHGALFMAPASPSQNSATITATDPAHLSLTETININYFASAAFAAPSAFSVISADTTATTATLTWTAPTAMPPNGYLLAGYAITRQGSDGTAATLLASPLSTAYVDVNLTPSTIDSSGNYIVQSTYSYWIEALYANQTNDPYIASAAVASGPVSTDALPATPTGLVATTLSPTEVQLNWSVPTILSHQDPNVGWSIYRAVGTGSQQPPQSAYQRLILNDDPTDVDHTNSYDDTNLNSGSNYYWYEVVATDSVVTDGFGNVLYVEGSAPSIPAEATNVSGSGSLVAPTDLVPTTVAANEVTLNWDYSGNGESGFKVYRRNSSTAAWTYLGPVAYGATSFTDTTVSPLSSYQYEVSAYVIDGPELFCGNIAEVTTPATVAAPPPPGALNVVAPTTVTELVLNWTGPNGVTVNGYNVYQSNNQNGPWTLVNTTGLVTGFTEPVTGLTQGSTYYFQVRAVFVINGHQLESNPATGNGVPGPAPAFVVQLNPITLPTPPVNDPTGVIPLTQTTGLVGIVAGDIGSQPITSWSVTLNSNDSDSGPITVYQTAGTVGTLTGPADPLCNFDPSLYPSGSYYLKLTAFSAAGSQSSIGNSFLISNTAQMGNFTLPVTDMTVNVPGQSPIAITRTYNSTNATVSSNIGDGWNFSFADSNFQTTATGPGLSFGDILYITLPDGEQHAFQFLPVPESYQPGGLYYDPISYAMGTGALFMPQFVCIDGSNTQLDVKYDPADTAGGDFSVVDHSVLAYDAATNTFVDANPLDLNNQGTPYNPSNPIFGNYYDITTADGTQYDFNGSGQLQSIKQTDGDSTAYNYNSNGILLSITAGSIGVDFSYNSDNRVTSIMASTGQKVTYSYSGVDLTSVTQPQDQGSTHDTFAYSYNGAGQLDSIENGLGVQVAQTSYDPNSGLFTGISNATGSNSTASTSAFSFSAPTPDPAQTMQTVTNAAGDETIDLYDAAGNVIRNIQEISTSDYLVTIYSYSYASLDVDSAMNVSGDGVNITGPGATSSANTITEEAVSQPTTFTDLTDAENAQPNLPTAGQTSFYFAGGSAGTSADWGQIEDQTVYTTDASGKVEAETTAYSGYVDGKPTHITDPLGNQTVNTYNATTGNLMETAQYAPGVIITQSTTPLSATYYTYTTANDGIPANLPVETYQIINGNTVVLSYNSYYGNTTENIGSTAFPIFAQAANFPNVAGELFSTTTNPTTVSSLSALTASGNSTFYAYDIEGNQVLSYSPKTWTTNGGATENGWVVSETAYDGGGRSIATWQGTYLQGTGSASTFNYSVNSSENTTTPPITDTINSLYDDLTQAAYSSGTQPLETSTTTYNAAGQVYTTTDQYGGVTTNYYDADGNLVETTNPDGTETETVYDAQGRVILSTDSHVAGQSGNATRTIYDDSGRVVATQQLTGVTVTVSAVSGETGVYQVTAVSGGGLTDTVASGLYTWSIDPTFTAWANQTTTAYNALGQVGSTTDAEGLTTAYTYYPTGQQETSTQENVPVWNSTTGANVATNLTTTNVYDLDGRETSTTNPEGNIVSGTEYDALGRVIETDYDDGSYSETLYSNSSGVVPTVDYHNQTITAPSGLTIPTGGSETIQIAQHKLGDTLEATFDLYNAAGNLVAVYQPSVIDGKTTDSTYNTSVAPETEYTYDIYGDELTQKDANNNTTTYTYDENGNMLSETLPDGTNKEMWTYNQFGQMATFTDFDGNVATYTYYTSGVHAGMLEQVQYVGASGSGKAAQTVTYTYDDMNRQSTVADASGTTTYTYDANGNVIEEDTPEGDIHYIYNNLNQQTETWTGTSYSSATTDTVYGYDVAGRLTTVTQTKLNGSSFDLVTTYAYDEDGNKVYEKDPNNDITTYTYDTLNRLTGETVINGSNLLYSVEYTLNHDGTRATALEAMKQSAGTTLYTFTDWTYDGEARLIDESVTNITTSSFNLPSGYILSSAFSQGMTWDNANAFTTSGVTEGNITTIEGAVLFDPSAGTKYGGNGNEWVLVTDAGVGKLDVTSFTLSYAGTFTRDDVLNPKDYTTATTFALSGSPTGYNNAYSYDLVGNRTKDVLTGSEDGTAGTTTYSYNGDNELTQTVNGSVTTNYGYDDNGSQTSVSVGTTTTALYSYDVRNRLQKVVNSGGTTTYVYDDAGDRVQETTGTTTTYYLIDTQNPSGYSKPIEVRVGSATGTPTTTYILGQSVIGQANSSGAVSYLLIDGREDTRALVNSSGTVTATFSYDDFGNPVGFTMSSAPTEFLFQQSMFDAPSGLNILGDGQREEQVGQDSFIERDPNGYSNNDDPLTLNGYLFDGANPITNIDLNGHDFDYITILATAGISAALMGTLSGGLAALSGRNVIYNSVVGIGGGLALTSAFFDGQLPKVAANAIVVTAMTTLLLGFLDYEFKGPNFVKSHITTYESVAVETFSWASISEAWFPASSYTSLDGTKDPQVGKLLQDITLAFGQTFAEGVALLGDVAGLATGAISNATAKSELTDAFKTIAGNLLSTGISLAVDTLFMSSFGGEVPSDVKSGIFTDLKGGLISNSLSAGISDICSELADLIVDKVAG